MGEVAPTYFASDEARERLIRTFPEARIICIFRDPVERIISHYRVKRAYGMLAWDLEQAIRRDPELIESSKYATHLKAWQRTFGSDQVVATLMTISAISPKPMWTALQTLWACRASL